MKRNACLVFSACAICAAPVFGNGFYVPVQAPEATARGNAWLATADTPAAVYYNAAGLTQLDSTQATVGAYAIMLGLEADLDSGATADGKDDFGVLPQIYAAMPVYEKLVAGFGLNTPFGLATDWGQNSQFRYLATETQLQLVTGWFVLGYEVTDTFSIGGGFGVSHADLKLGQVINNAATGGADVLTEFNGDSDALSYTLSSRWQPHEQHAFGLVYRSKSDYKLDGDYNLVGIGKQDATFDFMTPSTVGAGYAYSPCKEWSFEANIEWVNWDELNSLNLKSGGATTPVAFNWNSNFIYSVGATRYFGNGWNVSAGYNYIENSMPDSTFTPAVADADRHWLNAGVGRQYDDFRWSFAYQFAFSENDVSGSPGGLADGNFKSRFHGLMLNGTWQF
jgi:long-chain fatty acid transport protein